MTDCEIVFVVLVWRNAGDLSDFLASLQKACPVSYRAVVVNSFCDEESRRQAEQVSRGAGCDFLSVENRGYGSGNNRGIAYARAHYTFRWLAVCNPDTVLQNLPAAFFRMAPQGVWGPEIRTRTGKRQNPCMPLPSPLREALLKAYARHPRFRAGFFAAIALNKSERILYHLFLGRVQHRVYALHGSFLLFSAPALAQLGDPFDPRMFLFREEDYLARRCRQLGILMIFDPELRVFHKEDGSLRLSDVSVTARTLASLRVYFGLDRPGK